MQLDMPEIQMKLLEPANELAPFGAQDVTEDSVCPMAVTIANAIYNAAGIRLSITAARLLVELQFASPVDHSSANLEVHS